MAFSSPWCFFVVSIGFVGLLVCLVYTFWLGCFLGGNFEMSKLTTRQAYWTLTLKPSKRRIANLPDFDTKQGIANLIPTLRSHARMHRRPCEADNITGSNFKPSSLLLTSCASPLQRPADYLQPNQLKHCCMLQHFNLKPNTKCSQTQTQRIPENAQRSSMSCLNKLSKPGLAPEHCKMLSRLINCFTQLHVLAKLHNNRIKVNHIHHDSKLWQEYTKYYEILTLNLDTIWFNSTGCVLFFKNSRCPEQNHHKQSFPST